MNVSISFLLILLLAGCQEKPQIIAPQEPEPSSNTQAETPPVLMVPATFADVVSTARPAVVNIYTRMKVKTRRPAFLLPGMVPEERLSESLGSGFIIDPSGLVLTNYHVIADATEIEVRLFDDRKFRARVIGDDPKTDLALIQLENGAELPALELADSELLRVGDWVVAIGNPLGLTSTVTAGIVSATGRRQIPLGDLRYQDFIQTDASINPGNSGGPLINMNAQVVGINTAVTASAQGIGFAIPINMVKELLPKLRQGRVERSWLGIYVDEVPEKLTAELGIAVGGALVTRIVRGGPADMGKLRPGDIILEIDGDQIRNADELAWKASNIGVGTEAQVRVQRGNEEARLMIRMGALPD